ncbi:MAG: ribosomal RNA small subunit methyltransferase A, partial [Planctomycetes bacterium]|nr:ribosomal RNA small subunit methyltransferase A [Planctomycetota bacterium]
FGQNFLIDLNLMRKLVEAAGVCAGDIVLEVGPGTGSLTELLLERGAEVVAVEIDRGLAELLGERFADQPRLTLLCCDALAGKHEVHPGVIKALGGLLASRPAGVAGRLKMVSNLPYQVATPLLLNLLCGEPPFDLFVFTIQKEVAERLTARTGTADYGPISVITSVAADCEVLSRMPPSAFWPRPKVESSMLVVRPKPRADDDDLGGLAALVGRAFLHRRQMLRRIVSRWANASAALSALEALGIDSATRPQDLGPDLWRRFHRRLRGE